MVMVLYNQKLRLKSILFTLQKEVRINKMLLPPLYNVNSLTGKLVDALCARPPPTSSLCAVPGLTLPHCSLFEIAHFPMNSCCPDGKQNQIYHTKLVCWDAARPPGKSSRFAGLSSSVVRLSRINRKVCFMTESFQIPSL